MAKLAPVITLRAMEEQIGHRAELFRNPYQTRQMFYSDMTLVPEDLYQQAKKEYYFKMRSSQDSGEGPLFHNDLHVGEDVNGSELPSPGEKKVLPSRFELFKHVFKDGFF